MSEQKSNTGKQKFEESLVTFFDERVCSHADTIYRFCYGTTLNASLSKDLTFETFSNLTSELRDLTLYDDTGLKVLLMYYAFKNLNTKNISKIDDSKYASLVKDLSIEQRSLFIAVDILGLNLDEATRVFNKQEDDLRSSLAGVREHILTKLQ